MKKSNGYEVALSDTMMRLKRLTQSFDSRLYANIEKSWMSLCLLEDKRLASKWAQSPDIGRARQDIKSALLAAIKRLELACSQEHGEVLKMIDKLKDAISV